MPSSRASHLRFEVFGVVTGVSFRVSAAEKARQLGITGWIANTSSETVKGEAVGAPDNIAAL
jgi:acylphosphatase